MLGLTAAVDALTTESNIEDGSSDYRWSRWIMQINRERDALREERKQRERDARLFQYGRS